LPAFISITDHDDVEAGLRLQVIDSGRRIPISPEWTVPYGEGFFHLGVHNLPREFAAEITRELLKYSHQTRDAMRLGELQVLLNESSGTLVVLSHPLWDIEFIGAERHRACLKTLLVEHGERGHAFEINGFRSWAENRALRLALTREEIGAERMHYES
jgi:hypothetical protein